VSRALLAPALVLVAAFLARGDSWYSAVVFALLVPALAWRQRTPFLGVWFLALFLPMLRVFTEHIHFLYALVPASITLAAATESLWRWSADRPGALSRLRHAVAAVAVLVAADQALTLYGTWRTMHATYDGIDAVASRLRPLLRRDDILVSNVIHGEEIWYHAGYSYRNCWTIPWGIPDPRRALTAPRAFRALLTDPHRSDVYLLSVDFEYLPEKLPHRNAYVHAFEIEKEDLGVVHRTSVCYPFLDPLRHLIPRAYVPFLGAPDLVNDFYCGRARDGRRFTYEVGADYHLYRVTGRELVPLPVGPVSMAREGVAGFNILRIGDGYHGIPQAVGAFDVEKYRRGDYGPRYTGLIAEEVRQKILERDRPPGAAAADP
jgi:hypothetical protein